jgi:2-polyprenyl-6-hydroxyphenyl methylase/3-demethylubiquinone-9 3-methyltransferase
LTALLEGAGLTVADISGLSFDPRTGFVVSASLTLDYFVTARKGA